MANLDKIRKAARSTLMELFHQRMRATSSERGALAYNKFFPIDPQEVIVDVLKWKIRPLSDYDRLAKSDFGQKVIFFNTTDIAATEQVFSLAHEIGHAVLHARIVDCYGGSLNRLRRSSRRGMREQPSPELAALETDADLFAAELLMPSKPVRQHFELMFGVPLISTASPEFIAITKRGIGAPPYDVALELAISNRSNLRSLADQFGTSRSAMARRLVHLGLVHS